jgi:aspartate aminotransferase
MPIADKMVQMVEGFVTIKNMFEEGARLKAEHGKDKVFDFSLGNPDVPAPPEFKKALKELVINDNLTHGYMPNKGYRHVRRAVADYLNKEHGTDLTPDFILMTVGATGALNNALRSLINPGEEILTPSPYFIGYTQYAFSAHATLTTAASDERFHLDFDAIEQAITGKTRVVLINSPNNPTGVVYGNDELKQLGQVLERASGKYGKRIYLLSDEPYRKITYDVAVPSVFRAYPHSLIANSYSKDLSLAGERIGYLAVNPEAEDADMIVAAATATNTMLYVNAPSLFQLAVAKVQDATVDVSRYRHRRDMMCDGLAAAGYEFNVPDGAFYLFPKSPLKDEMAFMRILMEDLILVAPGRGFGMPGYFRISYAVPSAVISGSMNGFKRAIHKARRWMD